ncbi:MAG: type II toxin-antitoxin system YafQ family toxin [Treponemataceae bacterium]|nr:type II toxin-antitoxin system YafQ family toxin [Treponemataceae bacterium]
MCIRRFLNDAVELDAAPQGKFCDHELTGNFAGHRECHILSDLLLIYKIYLKAAFLFGGTMPSPASRMTVAHSVFFVFQKNPV